MISQQACVKVGTRIETETKECKLHKTLKREHNHLRVLASRAPPTVRIDDSSGVEALKRILKKRHLSRKPQFNKTLDMRLIGDLLSSTTFLYLWLPYRRSYNRRSNICVWPLHSRYQLDNFRSSVEEVDIRTYRHGPPQDMCRVS